jgi:acetyltransferase-like isoleucine patch superfamily enzyme
MLFGTLVRNVLVGILTTSKRIYLLSKLSVKHPTCHFDISCQIANCKFERYVVVFGNTKLYATNIGAYSYVQIGGRIFNSEIGRFCSIASGVSIAPGIHDMSRVSTHPIFVQKSTPLPKVYAIKENIISQKKVQIGNDVWIGEKVVILDGIKVGNGAVIASGAIVVKDVEPYSVVGGVPARHIKYRFDEQTINALQNSQWWNYPDEWFEENSELMLDVGKFIEKILCSQKES